MSFNPNRNGGAAMNADSMKFTFSDLIAGYVKKFDWETNDRFILETSDHREFVVKIGDFCYAEVMRNLGQAMIDCTGQMTNMLAPGRFLFVYGIFYPEHEEWKFEAKHIVFSGRAETEFVFEKQNWWIKQVHQLADFYVRAEFGDGPIDYRAYTTDLDIGGSHTTDHRQETDTISRLVYGFASAYLMTGEDRYLEAAEAGTRYLREHFRCSDPSDNTTYWYHAIVQSGTKERKIFASENGEDYDAIPAYEQIYALAGPTQTYRITGDPLIENDIRMTINFFQKYFLDTARGGYYSHVDPVMFDGQSVALGTNRDRKNWNSIGDHAPAYLINAVLATGNEEWGDMLEYCADLITEHFQAYDYSPFINEKFHGDWSHDLQWGWLQNRSVIGHNLKIAWNLMRINSWRPKDKYVEFAKKIAELMPQHGYDRQRTGWYDVVTRTLGPEQEWNRFAWHDRKAWWQQEQGILAYQILAGTLKDPEYLRYARESAAFYNAWFLDHDAGGVYFNVMANGMPYLLGTERKKGSHSMAGYHSFELAYLSAVYTNFLLTHQGMDFYFKPLPNGFRDRKLCVAPDMLPKGSVRLESVTIDGMPYENFDAETLTITLPQSDARLTVKAHVVPTVDLEHFTIAEEGETMVLAGRLDARAVPYFQKKLAIRANASTESVTIDMTKLEYMSREAARALMFQKQKMPLDAMMTIRGANAQVKELLTDDEFVEEVVMA
jgi:mannose/cellobiose epimerase-like protein (N-acyl-D-glucosamine 2-epimerase family)/anti-anti-sigma regulatory factor